MRKFASLFTVLMLMTALAFGQTRKITGKVSDDKGNPVPFASVIVKGTKNGVAADATGFFSINANEGSVLTITGVGFKPTDVTVGTSTFITTTLERGSDLS